MTYVFDKLNILGKLLPRLIASEIDCNRFALSRIIQHLI